MELSLETGLMLLLILVSGVAVASYARYRMDVRVRLTSMQLGDSLDDLNAQLLRDRESGEETARQLRTGLQSLQELNDRIGRLRDEQAENLALLRNEQQLLHEQSNDLRKEQQQLLHEQVSQVRNEQQQLLHDQVSQIRDEAKVFQSDIRELTENRAQVTEAELLDLQTRLDTREQNSAEVWRQLDVDRVADVEQIAVIAGVMAADGLAAIERNEMGKVPEPIHGHSLMLYRVLADFGADRIPEVERYHLLEIGTTREKWWGQMSTSRLALLCRALGLKMISVDIDEESSASGRESTKMYGTAADIHTEAGEVFLRNWEGALPPYIYVDAYDYYHEDHSDHRMQRYETLQGEKINDPACWKMHLDCAEQFVAKCPPGGIVVFDDVFFEDGAWAGKGKDAVPFMLDGGFHIVGQTPRTLILCKD